MDHVNPEKFTFRAASLRYDGRRTKMLELYAGVGYLTTLVYGRRYPELVLVEKDRANFRRLVRRVARFAGVHYYHKDNAAFIAEDLGDHLDFSAVDFDSFSAPGETVMAFLETVAGNVAAPFLLLMTDGGLLAFRRRAAMNLRRHYLYGPDEVRKVPAGLADRFKEFQGTFVARAAARGGFRSARRRHTTSGGTWTWAFTAGRL